MSLSGADNVPSIESVAAKIEAYEERKRAKKAARAAAQGKTLSSKSLALSVSPLVFVRALPHMLKKPLEQPSYFL